MKRAICLILALALLLFAAAAQAEWKVGDSFELGKWSMDGNAKPIRWTVLSINSMFLVCMADEPVAYYPWNSEEGVCTWNDCSLRKWLNEDFKDAAFSKKEAKAVMRQMVVNTIYTDDPDAGLDTWDYVYIPTLTELKTYNADLKPEDLALGAEWWLRDHGADGSTGAFVDAEGNVQAEGAALTEYKAVRPVIVVTAASVKK